MKYSEDQRMGVNQIESFAHIAQQRLEDGSDGVTDQDQPTRKGVSALAPKQACHLGLPPVSCLSPIPGKPCP